MNFHLCVPIDTALKKLSKGDNFFNVDSDTASRALIKHKNAGKKYFTGCDNEDSEGKCAGHEN